MGKYAPKYLLFLKNMRGVLAVRALRQIHWIRKLFKNAYVSSASSAKKIKKIVSVEKLSNFVDSKVVTFLTPPRSRQGHALFNTYSSENNDLYQIEELDCYYE